MTIVDKIRMKNFNTSKMSALSSGKIDKYEYLTGDEILPFHQRRVYFTYSSSGKTFEKQIKTIEDQEIKQLEALKALKPEENQELKSIEGLYPKEIRSNGIKNEIDEIKKLEDKIKRKDLKNETNKYIYDLQ